MRLEEQLPTLIRLNPLSEREKNLVRNQVVANLDARFRGRPPLFKSHFAGNTKEQIFEDFWRKTLCLVEERVNAILRADRVHSLDHRDRWSRVGFLELFFTIVKILEVAVPPGCLENGDGVGFFSIRDNRERVEKLLQTAREKKAVFHQLPGEKQEKLLNSVWAYIQKKQLASAEKVFSFRLECELAGFPPNSASEF